MSQSDQHINLKTHLKKLKVAVRAVQHMKGFCALQAEHIPELALLLARLRLLAKALSAMVLNSNDGCGTSVLSFANTKQTLG